MGQYLWGNKQPLWDSLSQEKQDWYNDLLEDFKDKSVKNDFDVDKWISGFDDMDEAAQKYFTTLDGAEPSTSALSKAMNKVSVKVESEGTVWDRLGEKASSTFTRIGNGLKSFGKMALGTGLNIGANLLINAAIQKGIELWDNYANAQENAIKRGNTALESMKSNQSAISSAQSVLDDLKANKVTLADGTETTRFEQLSKGVNSLGQNVSLTTEEFAEYNSMLDQMSSAGLNATNSMSELELQVKQLRTNMNTETLKGLDDWIDSFNAKNNQFAVNSTKEIGYQQKIDALSKIYSDPTKYTSAEDIDGHSFWDSLVSWSTHGAQIEAASQIINTEIQSSMMESANETLQKNIESITDTKALEELAKEFSIDLFDDDGNFSYEKYTTDTVQKQISDARDNLISAVESEVQQSSGFLQALFENSLNYSNLSESAIAAIGGIFSNVDYDTISSYMMDSNGMLSKDLMENWVNNLTENLTRLDVQDKLDQLFSLDTKKSEMTFSEFQKQANSLIKSISSTVPELSEDILKKTSGVDNVIEDLQGSYNKIVKQFGAANANKLNNSELEIAARIVGVDEFSGTFDELLKQIHEVKSELDLDAHPLYDGIKEAFERENAGDIYKDMVSKLKTAKELYDKGEIGTDDFKSVAKWLSPSGADDAMNFQENWSKAKRYFTEDSAKGVHNFLKDLEAKNLAKSTKAVDANGNAIEKWSYKLSDLEEAAQKLGIGFEPMMAMFGRLEDYGFSNNFVGSVDQGMERITEKSKELAEAEAHLAELEREGIQKNGKYGNQTAIDAQRDKIAQLKQDIIETTDCMKQLAEHSAEDYEAQVKGATSAIQTLADERQKILSDESMDKATRESIAGMMEDQIRAWAQEYHIELPVDLEFTKTPEEVVNDLDTELSLRVSNEAITTALSSLEELKQLGLTDFEFNFNTDSNGIDYEIQKAMALINQFRGVDGDIDLSINGADEALSIFSVLLAKKAELNQPAVMNVDTSQLNQAESAVITTIQEYQQARQELQVALELKNAGVDIDTSQAETKVNNLAEKIRTLSSGSETSKVMAQLDLDIDATTAQSQINSAIDGLTAETLEKTLSVDAKVLWNEDDSAVSKKFSAPGKVKWSDGDKSGVSKEFTATGHVTWVNNNTPQPSTSGKARTKSNGSFHTHSAGTAISAFVRGTQVELPRNEVALVNELGTESIVRNGHWFPIPGGAHFERLYRGDIIFNHLQTKELSNKGYVTSGGGHGVMAHARGTAISAYAGVGAGGGSLGYGGSGKKSSVSSTSKAANNTAKAAQNTAKAAQSAADATKDVADTLDWWARKVELFEHNTEVLLNRIDDYELYRNQNREIDAYIGSAEQQMQVLRNSQNAYMSKANSLGLSADYIHNIWSGDGGFEDIADEDLKEKIEKYQEYYDKAREIGDKMVDLNRTMRETKIRKLDNIKDDYDNLTSYHESLIDINDALNDLSESRNLVGNQSVLWNNLDQQKQIKAYYEASVREMQAQLDQLVSDGTIGYLSDTWFEWAENINAAKKAVIECDSAVEELKESIREIRLDAFNKMLETLEHTEDMASGIRDLFSSEGFFDEDINITNSGYAQLSLMADELIAAKQKVANYNTAIDALNKDLKNGDITQANYTKQLREYQKAQLDAIKTVKSAKDAILDMVKEGIEKETEAMEELIQKRKDNLSTQKEYYDFQKKMSNQSKEMNKIRAEMAAIEGDDRLEAQMRLKSLRNQLQELQDQYNEDIKDHEYDVVQDAYDDTLDEFKKNQEETLHELETNLGAQNQAINNYLTSLKDNYRLVYGELMDYATEYGFTMSEQLTQPWKDAQSALNSYLQAVGTISSNVSIETGKIQSSAPVNTSSNQVGNESSTQNLNKSKNGTWLKQDNRWWYQHDDGGWTENGWEQIDGKWYKFDQQGWMQSGWQAWGTDSTGQTAWYYLGDPSDGSMKTSTWVKGKDGKQYFVDHTGVMARNAYVKSKNSGLYYWVNNDGVWEPEWDTYNPDLKKYKLAYINGSVATHKGWAKYDEKGLGSEFIIDKQGMIREFDAGEMVFKSSQKNVLYNFSRNPSAYLKGLTVAPEVEKSISTYQPTITLEQNFHVDKVDSQTLPDMQKLLREASNQIVANLKREFKKLK